TYFRFKAPSPPPVLYARGYGSNDQYYNNTYLGGYITGFCGSEDGYGSATLRAADGTLKAQATNINACPSIYVNFGVAIEAGDVISAAFGGKTTTMTVPAFSATSDPDTDTVTGATNAAVVTTTYDLTRTLTLWPQTTSDNTSQPLRRIQPDVNGDFSATNPFETYNGMIWMTTTVDLRPGDVGHLRYIHADGNRTYFRFKAPSPPPVLYARGYGNSNQYSSNASLGGYITGFCSSEDGYGSATLRAADGTLKSQVTNIQACPSIQVNFSAVIEAGDVISATFGGKTTTMTVPEFTATVDPDTDTITGNTDADVVTTTYGLTRTLTLWPRTTSDNTSQALRRVQPAAGGDFSATNPFEMYNGTSWVATTVDLRPGDVGHLRYIHADGNRTYFRFKAPSPPPVLYARGYGNSNQYSSNASLGGYITGFCSSDDGYGSATLRAADGTLKAAVTGNYACPGIYINFDVAIEAGDVISAAFGGKTTTMTVPAFAVISDPDTDTVTGVTHAAVVTTTYDLTRTLTVWPQTTSDSTYSARQGVQPDAGGNFTAANPFETYNGMNWVTTTVDIQPGNMGHLRYIHADGNRTYVGFIAPGLYVRGGTSDYVADNYVYIRANAGLPVTVTLTRGATTLGTVSQWLKNDNTVGIYLTDEDDNPILIQAGDIVEAALPGKTLTAQVPALTAAPDIATGMVSGDAPANITTTLSYAPHTLLVYRDRNDVGYQVTTPASGAYSADFSANGGLRLGDTGWLRYINNQGYHIYENYWLPIVYVRGYENGYQSENYVSGYAAEAGALITATLRRGTAVVATTYDWSNASTGQFGIYLRDVYNYAANILGGDILELQTDSGTTVVPIPQFTATSNHEIDTISGATDALVTSQTPYMTQTLAIWPAYTYNWDYGKHILPEGGAFTAANPFYYYADPANPATTLDWSYGATGHARYINSDGNQVYMQFQAPLKPFVYVRGYYSNQSYYAGNSVGGYVNGFCGYGTATLRDGAGAIKAQTNSAWACNSIYATFTDMGGNAEPILPGDRVEVTFGGVTTSVDVPDFAVTSDPDHDRLTGTTNAVVGAGAVTQTLALWPTSLDDYSYGKRVTVSGGAFTAENPYYYYADPSYSAMTLHWDMGARGHLRYTDAHSNRVYERFWAPYPQPILSLRGSFWQQRYVADNFVSGYAPGFCGDIEITVRNSSGVRLQLRHLRACSDFEVYLYGPNGAALNIQAGDTVDVVFLETSLLPISVTAPEFNVDSDHINRTVSGSTNATVVTAMYGMSQTLAVWPTSLYDSSYGKYVQPTGGVFSATNPFYYNADPTNSSTTLSWSAGTIGHLRYIHAQWHHIYARFYRPDLLVYLRGDHPSYSEKGYVAENLVSGYAPGLCDYGNVTLKDGAGTVKAQADVYACSSFYVYMNDNMGYAANIQAGDQVEAVFGGITKTLTVPAFTARSDTELERVTGATNAAVGKDTSLTVYPTSLYESSAPYQNVQPVAGVFTASNPFRDADGYSMYVDIKPGDQGHLRYTYAAGDRVHYYFMAPYTAPRIWVQKDGYRVHGYMVENNAPITVTLRRGGAVIATATGYTGNAGSFYSYFYDTANMPFYIRAGDTVRVQAGATTVDVPVVALTAQADVVQDSVWGTGPANARLLVNDDYPVRTAADGAYRADLRGRSDLRPGSSYQVSYLNAEGHTVYLVQYVAQVSAQLHTNLAWGYGLTAGDPYTATLRTGAVVKGVGYGATSSSYYFAAYLYDPAGNPVLIAAGDTLEVNFGGGQVVTLPIVALTTQINVATGAVNGTGPANALLGVDPDAYSNDHSVMTNNTGQWATQILDFYSWQDAHVRVRYANAQGHEVWLYTAVRPTIFVRGTGSGFNYTGEQTVAGYADGRAIVNISLRRGGNVIAQQRTLAAAYGWYNTNLTETIQAGDELSVQWTPRGTHTLVVPPLEANANASAGEIFGVGPANATIGVKAHNYTQNTTTSATGAFNVGMPLVTGNEAIYLCYQTPEGYWIHARSTSAPPPTIVASFTQSALAIVVGDTVYFTDTSTTDGNAIVSWDWRFGDGGISTAQHPSHQYNSVGVFTVWLTVADALGYSDSQSATVTVAAGCVPLSGIAFTYQPSEPHVNEPITFTTTYTPTTATAPITYAWVFGDGQTGTAPNPIHTYQSGGNWTARVTAYNPCTPAGVTYQQAVVIGVNKIFLPLTLRNQ
ncbi:MAG TPA: PKD domain-containing protein, partial [Anaerolineae bacterium]|nr:PKD domain-containing protein [Anaerolineae bacterium]